MKNNTHRIFWFFTIAAYMLIYSTVFSCKRDDDDDDDDNHPASIKTNIEAIINGENWSAEKSKITAWDSKNGFYIKGTNNNNTQIILYMASQPAASNHDLGTYGVDPYSASYVDGLITYRTYQGSGTINISKVELSDTGSVEIITGVFSFTAVDAATGKDTLWISEGSFAYIAE